MARHFAARGAVLVLASNLFGFVMTQGRALVFNIVLVALGVDYLVAGLLWLGMQASEPALARGLERTGWKWVSGKAASVDEGVGGDDEGERGGGEAGEGEREPLLRVGGAAETAQDGRASHDADAQSARPSERAESASRTVHNMLLLALAFVTIWWNVWLSPTGGRCLPDDQQPPAAAPPSRLRELWLFWFRTVANMDFPAVLSFFPPLAWLSFAILGLLYGRVVAASSRPSASRSRSRSLSPTTLAAGNAALGALFALFFVLTRAFRFGNLSEDCLQTPEHHDTTTGLASASSSSSASASSSSSNPYLASAASFFYVVKYPPSPAFFALTLAGNFLLLAGLGLVAAAAAPSAPDPDGKKRPSIPSAAARLVATPLAVYGRSALFFYFAHIVLLASLDGALVACFGYDTDVGDDPLTGEPAKGIDSLWVFFATWAAALVALYFACGWYGRFKRSKGPDSVWRFF